MIAGKPTQGPPSDTWQASDLVRARPAEKDAVQTAGLHVGRLQQSPLRVLRRLKEQRVALEPHCDGRPMPASQAGGALREWAPALYHSLKPTSCNPGGDVKSTVELCGKL